MRAGLRLAIGIVGGGAGARPAPALAQEQRGDAPAHSRAATTIGPRELQNFSLRDGHHGRPRAAGARRLAERSPRRTTSRAPRRRPASPSQAAAAAAPTSQRRAVRRSARAGAIAALRPTHAVATRLAGHPDDRSLRRQRLGSALPPAGRCAPPSSRQRRHSRGARRGFAWLLLAAVLGAGAASCSGAAGSRMPRRRSAVRCSRRPSRAARRLRRSRRAGAAAAGPAPPRAEPPAAGAARAGRASSRRACGPWIDLNFEPAALRSSSRRAGDLRVRARAVQLGQRAGARRAGRGQPVQRRPDPGAGYRAPSSPIPPGQGERIAAIPPLKRLSLRTLERRRRREQRPDDRAGRPPGVRAAGRLQRRSIAGAAARARLGQLPGRPRHRAATSWRRSASTSARASVPRLGARAAAASAFGDSLEHAAVVAVPGEHRGGAAIRPPRLRQVRAAAFRSACRRGPAAGRSRPCTARSPAGKTSGPPFREQQIDFRRPAADALDLGQQGDRFLIVLGQVARGRARPTSPVRRGCGYSPTSAATCRRRAAPRRWRRAAV